MEKVTIYDYFTIEELFSILSHNPTKHIRDSVMRVLERRGAIVKKEIDVPHNDEEPSSNTKIRINVKRRNIKFNFNN